MKKIFRNKVVFITGASGNIGLAISKNFITNGAKVILQYNKGNNDFKKFCIKNSANIIKKLKINLENENDLEIKIKSRISIKQKIDILINSAAVASGSIFEMTHISNIKKIFQINFFAQLKIIQLIIKHMKRSDNASICNIGSISGIIPQKGNISYGTSKSALIFATKILSKELSIYNIRVNAIAPGVVTSRMADMMDKKVREKTVKDSPLGRELKPFEVAKKVLFISSANAKKINGQILKIDRK